MSVLSVNALTLADWAKRLDPDGKVPTIVELLSQTNEMLDDMLWMEGNLPTGHSTTVRTGLPTVAWRLINGGSTPSKSHTTQITEAVGILEAWSEVDIDLAKLNGNVSRFRASEAMAFLEAMNQEMQQTILYGNSGLAPEEFTGLTARYSALSGAGNSSNVISASGSDSDLSSIWLINWGDRKISGIFPKGSKAGLVHEDFGAVTTEVTAGVGGTRMRAYQERFQWKAGIAVEDWRNAVRICNIDISVLVANSAPADLPLLMIKALHRIPNLKAGRPAFYMNRTCREMLDIQLRDDVSAGGQLSYDVVDGKRTARFQGVPIRTVDQLLQTESTVS